jgi:hypothetical protein
LIKNQAIGNDLFITKKSFRDVPLNISNQTELAIFDEVGFRESLKKFKG